MKDTLEKLWNKCFFEECATIDSNEERTLLKKASEIHEAANSLLTQMQREAVEKYVDALYEIQGFIVKKAFFKGCELAASFLLETGKNK